MTATTTAYFITRCAFCAAEKSREERPDLTEDIVSHGMCTPICEPAKAKGWAKFLTKENGGEL